MSDLTILDLEPDQAHRLGRGECRPAARQKGPGPWRPAGLFFAGESLAGTGRLGCRSRRDAGSRFSVRGRSGWCEVSSLSVA